MFARRFLFLTMWSFRNFIWCSFFDIWRLNFWTNVENQVPFTFVSWLLYISTFLANIGVLLLSWKFTNTSFSILNWDFLLFKEKVILLYFSWFDESNFFGCLRFVFFTQIWGSGLNENWPSLNGWILDDHTWIFLLELLIDFSYFFLFWFQFNELLLPKYILERLDGSMHESTPCHKNWIQVIMAYHF